MLRNFRSAVFWTLCAIALLVIVTPAIAIIVSVVAKAIPVLRPTLLTNVTGAPIPGLQDAMIGSAVLLLGVLVVAGPIGILGGIYIAEMAPVRLGRVLRFFSEVLAGVPSIVIGFVGYVALVNALHWHFSLLAGILALSALIVPYITKTTEVSMNQVPRTLREAALAVGLSRVTAIRKVLLPPALPGIVSGLVLAMAISTGETAPLLFTAGYGSGAFHFSLFNQQITYLTGAAFFDVQLPDAASQGQASAAAAILILWILLLIFAGRLITARSRRMVARLDV
ncbi:MAG TPA: ABC transporter permease subunit [Candidatus Binatia bacterium]|nr:ABC transporter permease subunit [Candidatus Binatia bacterium]